MAKRTRKLLSLVLTLMLIIGSISIAQPVSAAEAGQIKVDPSVEYQTIEGWGTSICWWGNTVGTWIGKTDEKSIAYGEQHGIENMTIRDAIIHMMYSPEGLNLNMVRFCVGGGDGPDGEYQNTTIRRIDSMVPGWSIDMYGMSDGNNGGVVLESFWTKPIREMNDYGQLYVLQQAAKIRQEACAKEGKPNDLVVEVFANSPPFYMTESGRVTGGYRQEGQTRTGATDNLSTNEHMEAFAAYMATAAKYMDNMLKEYGASVAMVNPFNEPGTCYWGADHSGNMYKQEGCNVSKGDPQNRMLLKMRSALDANNMQNVFLTMGETDIGNTYDGFLKFSQEVKDIIPLIGTHCYDTESSKRKGSNNVNRVYLRDLAATYDKNLWQVEIGQSNGNFLTNSMSGATSISRTITRDLKVMQVGGWMDWNPVEPVFDGLSYNTRTGAYSASGWGLMLANVNSPAYGTEGDGIHTTNNKIAGPIQGVHNSSLWSNGVLRDLNAAGVGDYSWFVGKAYYSHQQYSRFLKEGYVQIDIADDNMLAFVSPDKDELVITVRSGSGSRQGDNMFPGADNRAMTTTIDLSAFPNADTAKVYTTSSSANCARIEDQDVSDGILDVNTANNTVFTYVITNNDGKALYSLDKTYSLVNSEVVYLADSNYSQTNKFQYSGEWTYDAWHGGFPENTDELYWDETRYPQPATNVSETYPSYNAYSHTVERATADGASVTFKFDGDSAEIWGLQKGEGDVATFNVAVDGEIVATGLTNEGTAGANVCLFNTGDLEGIEVHEITLTKVGEAGTLDIGNARIGTNTPIFGVLQYLADAADALIEDGSLESTLPVVVEYFEDCLAAAKAILANPDSRQLVIDTAAEELLIAIQMVDWKVADKSELEELIEEAEALDLDEYISAGKEELAEAIEAAKEVLDDENAIQEDVDAAVEAILEAIENLIKKADKTLLQKALELAGKLELSNYVEAGKPEFEAAYAAAQAVMANEDALQAEVDEAYEELMETMSALRLKVNKDKLAELLAKAQAKNEVSEELEEAMVMASILLGDEELDEDDQDAVNEAAANLEAALEDGENNEEPGTSEEPGDEPGDEPDDDEPDDDAPVNTGSAAPYAMMAMLAVSAAGIFLLRKKSR